MVQIYVCQESLHGDILSGCSLAPVLGCLLMLAFQKSVEGLQKWGKDTVTANTVQGTASLGCLLLGRCWVCGGGGGGFPTHVIHSGELVLVASTPATGSHVFTRKLLESGPSRLRDF